MSDKFVYTKGPYREFMGYVFANGLPAHIRDRATLEAISKHPDFRRDDEKVQRKEASEEMLKPTAKRGWPLGKSRK